MLGQWLHRTPIDKLDFDGDGKRDVAVWQAPSPGGVGMFNVLLSGTGYDPYQPLRRYFGQAGDLPAPMDYDGDGKTDIGVIRAPTVTYLNPTSDVFTWHWCRSLAGHDCTNYQSLTFGERGDVPLTGLEFDGTTPENELVVYRPRTDTVMWRKTQTADGGNIYLSDLGDPLLHVHGLYDADNLTDIAVYQPHTGQMHIFKSMSSPPWSVTDRAVKAFPSALVPNAVGATDAGAQAPAYRAGGILSLGAWHGSRRAAQMWDANTGTWHTWWNPLTDPPGCYTSCTFGQPGDVPLSGFVDRDFDGKSDFVLYRSSATGGAGGSILIKNSANGTCQGAEDTISVTVGQPRSVLSVVPDMGGDASHDVLMYDPEQWIWHRFLSPNYTQQSPLSLGTTGAVAL